MEKIASSSSKKRVKLEKKKKKKEGEGEQEPVVVVVVTDQVETGTASPKLAQSPKTEPNLAPEVMQSQSLHIVLLKLHILQEGKPLSS